ncbi:MAG TPA: CaiB/BaiF CoA-transferase family protein [Acidimicrobiia bacterium]|nr:CaiB/BaiF CoA-transferase family protein [Acidimicrobiia bacterium]
MGPLQGVRVVEMAGIGPVPWAGMMLADLGADVIRIDRVAPSPLDQFFPRDPTKRSRRSIALDLKQPQGVEVALRAVEGAQILIEGFRPGVMEKLGLGPDPCLRWNPSLVYGRMTGWGQTGPRSLTAGHDLNYLSLTGVLAAIGPESHSVPPLNLIGDYGGGAMLLLVGVLSAYAATQMGLPGQVVDAAMVDGVALLASLVHGAIASGTWNERRAENLLDGGAPFYRTYPTADGREIAVGALEPQFFSELLKGLGLDEADLPAQYDRSGWPRLAEAIGGAVASETMDHWEQLFASNDACVSPVRWWSEAPADPHLQSREVMIEVEGLMQAAPAPRFSHTPLERPRAPSNAGSNTRQVLGELGYDEAAIGMLLRHRVATEE